MNQSGDYNCRVNTMFYLNMISLFIAVILLLTAPDVVQGKRQSDADLSVKIQKVVATWDEAKEHCQSQGYELASPFDETLFKYMKDDIYRNNRSTEYFIGLKLKQDPEPQFISSEGILLHDMPDAVINMIEQLDPLEGECLAMSRNNIRVVPCFERLPYLCYKNATMSCDADGYEYSKETGSCYKIYEGPLNWHGANKTCTNDSAYLVILNDEHEAKTVVEMFSKKSSLPQSWVGLRDVRGEWRTVHGDPIDKIYNVWKRKNVLYFGDACALLDSEGELLNYFCNYYYHAICEKEARRL